MNYHNYYPTDMLNGEGIRAVLFVSGCTHGCRGCYNESTWDPRSGVPFTKDVEDQIIRDLKDTRIRRDGLTLSGGDPLHRNNLGAVMDLIGRVHRECPDKTVWMWTGYTIEEVFHDYSREGCWRQDVVRMVDVLVDGRFEQDKADPSLKWRGSSNQNIIEIRNL